MSSLDVLIVKENYELYTRIQNEKRKQLLSFIYLQSRKYKELMEYSGLKPGSLYHHLNILEPLIEKQGHGTYSITELGAKIVEDLKLVDASNGKPKIILSDTTPPEPVEVDSDIPTIGTSNKLDDKLSLIWLGYSNYIILGIIIVTSILMAIEGIALAGSALYATGTGLAFKFDFVALSLGFLSIYVVETLRQSYPIYNRLQFILIVRLMSMLPGTVLSIGLYLLFSSDVVPSASVYPWLFMISLTLGTITAAIGVSYLRSQSIQKSMDLAILLSIIDLLLGIIVLLT